MSKQRAIVLLSGGLDSSVNFYQSLLNYDVVLALTINYGQKAFEKEKQTAEKLCQIKNIQSKVVDLPWLKSISTSSALTNSEKQIPTSDVNIGSVKASQSTAKAVWVSNRNGLFINVAASFAEELKAKKIIVGFNKEEAATFPDNSKDFIEAVNKALHYSTQNQVQVESFTIDMNKKQIVQMGRDLKLDFDLIWPCYFSGDQLCQQCESCKRYLSALA